MKRLIPNWISYIVLTILTLLFTIYYRQSFFLVLLLLLCFLPVVSYGLCRYGFNRLTVSLASKAYMADKPATLPLFLTIKNHSPIPFSHFEIDLHISSFFYKKESREKLVLPAYAKKHTTNEFPIAYEKSGCYQARVYSVSTYDFLQLFYFSKPCDVRCEVQIMPRATGEVSYHSAIYGEGFDEYEETSLKGNVSSNVTDVREYRPGDRFQKIHWKLSARTDNLMVKENEATTSNRFVVLTELYQPDFSTAPQSEHNILDATLDYTFMLAKELLQAGESFFLTCYSIKRSDFASFFICTMDEFYLALSQIFYESTYNEANLGIHIYEKTKLNQGTVLHVTHEGVKDVLF